MSQQDVQIVRSYVFLKQRLSCTAETKYKTELFMLWWLHSFKYLLFLQTQTGFELWAALQQPGALT